MRSFLAAISSLFLLTAFALVYTLRIYWLSSALLLLAWLAFLLVGAHLRSRVMALLGALFWLFALIGFARVLSISSPEQFLPDALWLLRDVYYAVFLLPLAGLPFLRLLCLPVSTLMFSLAALILWFLCRSARANRRAG